MKRIALACLVAVVTLAVGADITATGPGIAAVKPFGALSTPADAHEMRDAARGIEDQGAAGDSIADAIRPVPRPIAPEPPSMLLAGVALGLLGWTRRRRARR